MNTTITATAKYIPEKILSNFDLEKIVQKEIRVIGSRSQKPADWEPSLQLLSTGDVNAEALITKELDITQWNEGYNHIKSGDGIKVLLRPVE